MKELGIHTVLLKKQRLHAGGTATVPHIQFKNNDKAYDRKKDYREPELRHLTLTEIGLLIRQSDTALPVFDTTRIHAQRAAALALEESDELPTSAVENGEHFALVSLSSAFAEGENEKVLLAADDLVRRNIARPVLVGRTDVILKSLQRNGVKVFICSGRAPSYMGVVLDTIPVTFDGIVGVPVIERLKSTVQGNRDAQKVLNGLYDSNLSQKMVLSYTSSLSDDSARSMAKLVSDYAAGKLRDRGVSNVIPIPLGSTLTPLNMKLADSQFLDLRKYSAIQIASAFGIKPYQIGDYGKESYSSQTAQQLAFYKDTLLWIVSSYEQELTYKLLSDRERREGLHFKFNVATILRADLKTQIETLSTAVSNFIYTPNEARAALDLEAKEGGDELLGNGAAIPVGMAGAQYAARDADAEGGEQ